VRLKQGTGDSALFAEKADERDPQDSSNREIQERVFLARILNYKSQELCWWCIISKVFRYIPEGLEGLATISATRRSRSLRKYLLYKMMTRATEFVWYFAIKPTGDKEDAYRHLGLV